MNMNTPSMQSRMARVPDVTSFGHGPEGSIPGVESARSLRFRKMHGAANDFVVLSDADSRRDMDWPGLASSWCARHTGVGADGLVMYRIAADKVLQVRCLNADGSEAAMCGNALRCAAWCAAHDHGWTKSALVMAGVAHHAQVDGDTVWVTANLGAVEPRRIEVPVADRLLGFDAVDTGTEHVVAVVDNVDDVDVPEVGRLVRYHPRLAPWGSNVNFVQLTGEGELRVRTYERGVEAETLSCGSGAVAAAVIAHRRGLIDGGSGPVTVQNKSGTPLIVRRCPASHAAAFWVGGPVACVFEGDLV